MTLLQVLQLGCYLLVLLSLVKPLGWYMARVYEGKPCGLDRLLGPIERAIAPSSCSRRSFSMMVKGMPETM